LRDARKVECTIVVETCTLSLVVRSRTIGALIVDDEEDIRALMRVIIEAADEGLFVCGEAGDGHESLDLIDELEPAVIVIDQRMPGLDGMETARRIRMKRPDQKMVLCSAYLDDEGCEEAAALGIGACLPKADVSRLPDVLREVLAS
jgi:DNA-binding NarL/FixJ family response regulator